MSRSDDRLDEPFTGFDEFESTRDFKERVADRVKRHDSAIEEIRRFFFGAKLVLGLLGALATLATAGIGWTLKTIIDTQSDVHSLATEVHVRFDDQGRRIDMLEHQEERR